MNVTVNGEPQVLDDGTTVQALVGEGRGRAVAVNGAVVRGADWATTTLCDDDRVEVVSAHQGG